MTEHMPGFAVGECLICRPYMMGKASRPPPKHAHNPAPCDCELGRLRAENERLEREVESLQTGVHTCHDKCPRPVCVQRREIERLQQAIKDAPCPEHDPRARDKGYCCCCRCGGGDCDCWKLDALEAK